MRVFGITRQSKGDVNSKSVEEQLSVIEDWCERQGHELVGHVEEQDVSGGLPFERRPGLVAAVEAVESGDADMVVAAYFNRLFRSVEVQIPFVKRVERAGGRVESLDLGQVSHRTAAKRMTSTFLGAVAENLREQTAERVRVTHERLSAEGKWIGAKVPIGYRKGGDGHLEPDPETAPVVLDAYQMRERGASLEEIRRHVRDATGLPVVSLNIVQRMLRNPVYTGAVVRRSREKSVERGWGDLVNQQAHEAIVPGDLFRRVSGFSAPRGKRSKSDRPLARLGVLRCGSCGSRMVVATATGSKNERIYVYRCPPGNDCTSKQSITATIAEDVVVHATRLVLSEYEGRAGGETRTAEARVERARAAMAAVVEAFDGFGDVIEVRTKLAALRSELEATEDELDRARRSASFALKPGLNWDELTSEERRVLIRNVVERADVLPGRGAERVRVTLAPELRDVQRVLDRAAASFRADLAAEM